MAGESQLLPPISIREYEKSPAWTKKSKALLDNKEFVCEICGRARWKWQPRAKKWKRQYRGAIHHRTYINVPAEHPGDLMCLCSCCHSTAHDILRMRNLGDSPMWAELATVVEKYFEYDSKSYTK